MKHLDNLEICRWRQRQHAKVHTRRILHIIILDIRRRILQQILANASVDGSHAPAIELDKPGRALRRGYALVARRGLRGLHEAREVQVNVLTDVGRRGLPGRSGLSVNVREQRGRLEQLGALLGGFGFRRRRERCVRLTETKDVPLHSSRNLSRGLSGSSVTLDCMCAFNKHDSRNERINSRSEVRGGGPSSHRHSGSVSRVSIVYTPSKQKHTVCLIQMIVGSIGCCPSFAIFASSALRLSSYSLLIGNSSTTAFTG